MWSTALPSTRTRSNRPVELPWRTRPNPPRDGDWRRSTDHDKKADEARGSTSSGAVDTPTTDRAALSAAYQTDLITAWKHDGERGYRQSLPSISGGWLAHPTTQRSCRADARIGTGLLHARLSAPAALVEPVTAVLISPTVSA
jgi:hypothetical protein